MKRNGIWKAARLQPLGSGRWWIITTFLIFLLMGCTPADQEANSPSPAIPTSLAEKPILTLEPSATATASPIDPPTETPTPLPSLTPTRIPPPPPITDPGQLWVSPIDGAQVVGVPAGEFEMGAEGTYAWESPAHVVYLDAFYIDRYEVTNALYRKCVEAGVCHRLGKPDYYNDPALDQHPVVNVTLAWAKTYCAWAGKRLPTEAEWEKAARGAEKRTFPWGEEIDCEHAQYKDCGGQTVEVGSHPASASPYGAEDMAGNVTEWVTDRFHEDYYEVSPLRNPKGHDRGNEYVIRGGSWAENSAYIRTSYRSWYNPNAQYYNLGFRCVRPMP